MNYKIFIVLIVFFSFPFVEIVSQTVALSLYDKHRSNEIESLPKNPKTLDNFSNFPFAFGTELMFGASFREKSEFLPGFLFFFDINLSKNRETFLKAEYGYIFGKDEDSGSKLLSIGINKKILYGRRDNLYFHVAAVAVWGNKGSGGAGGGLSGFLSLRYMHAFDDYFGIVTSIRYPFADFRNIMFTTGIQIFTR